MTRKSTKSADQTSRKECDHVRNGTVVVQKSLGFLSVSNFEYGQPASFIQASKQRLVACANRLLVYHGATIQSRQTTGSRKSFPLRSFAFALFRKRTMPGARTTISREPDPTYDVRPAAFLNRCQIGATSRCSRKEISR